MTLIPYADWSRRSRGATPGTHPIGATRGVTLHWEGPRMGPFPHSACDDKVRSIQAFHRDVRGWADIAYSALVCPHGVIFEGRGVWTKSAANGGTASNDTHYAVCYIGGQGDGFTTEGRRGFVEAVQWLRRKGGAGPEVNGHRDHKATACPGVEIYHWLQRADFNEEDDMTPDELRAVLRAEVPALVRAELVGVFGKDMLVHTKNGITARRALRETHHNSGLILEALAAHDDDDGCGVEPDPKA